MEPAAAGVSGHLLFVFTSIFLFADQCQTLRLTIVHTNDVHSRFLSYNSATRPCSKDEISKRACWDGVARRSTAIKELKAKYKNALLFDAGDQFQGTLWYTTMKWRPIAAYINTFNYTAMTFGNHEFDESDVGLAPYLAHINIKIVSCNIDASKSTYLNGTFKKYMLIDASSSDFRLNISNNKIDPKTTIAITGVTTSTTPDISTPGRNVLFLKEAEAVKGTFDNLKTKFKNLNKFIVLSHAGYTKDIDMCRKVPGLDIVVGGHSHTFLYNVSALPKNETLLDKPEGPYPTVVERPDGKCLVVQASAFGKYVGLLHVDFDDDGKIVNWTGNPILIDSRFPEDPEVVKLLKSYEQNLTTLEHTVVGSTSSELNSLNNSCRIGECTVGNLIADSFLDYLKNDLIKHDFAQEADKDWFNASKPLFGFAIINGGGLKELYAKPGYNLTLGDIYNLLPYPNTLKILVFNASIVQKLFERSIEGFFTSGYMHGKFLQVSKGTQIVYSLVQPQKSCTNSTKVAQHVDSVKIPCILNCAGNLSARHLNFGNKNATFDRNEKFVVAMSSFTAEGKDGNPFLPTGSKYLKVADDILVDVLLSYVKNVHQIRLGNEKRLLLSILKEKC